MTTMAHKLWRGDCVRSTTIAISRWKFVIENLQPTPTHMSIFIYDTKIMTKPLLLENSGVLNAPSKILQKDLLKLL